MKRRRRIEVYGMQSSSADVARTSTEMLDTMRALATAGLLFVGQTNGIKSLEHAVTLQGTVYGMRQGAWS
jgi:hypothetical protein